MSQERTFVVLASVKTNTLIEKPRASVRSPIHAGRQRVSNALRKRVVDLYISGRSTREIAQECCIGKTTVLQVLDKAGVTRRPRGGRA